MSTQPNDPLSGLSLSGGLPTKSPDLAASIIFCAAYALLMIPLIIRLIRPSSRHTILIRPLIFLQLQAVGAGLRAALADGDYSTGLFIASQICSLAGFVLICEPIVAIFQSVVSLHSPNLSDLSSSRLTQVARLARIILIVSLALGIWAATEISTTMSQSDIDQVHDLREANAALVIVSVGGAVLGTAWLVLKGMMGVKHAGPIVWTGAFVLIVAAYKLDTAIHPTDNLARGTKVGYYLLLALPQWLAALPFAVLNIKQLYFPPAYADVPGSGQGTPEAYKLEGQSQQTWQPNGNQAV